MYLINIVAKSSGLTIYFVYRFSYYALRNRMPLSVVSMLNNVRLYGPSHVCVDTPSVTLFEYLNPNSKS